MTTSASTSSTSSTSSFASVFSERRAGDRKKMADIVMELVTECGAQYKLEDSGDYMGKNAVYVLVTAPGGLELTVEFDSKSWQPDVYVLSWHMSFKSDGRLNNETFGGDVNPHHQRKATYVARGFDDLCKQLRFGLMLCKDGSAYLPVVSATSAAVAVASAAVIT